MADTEKKVVKKIKPYPIAVDLQSGNGTIKGQIVKLAATGFLVETSEARLPVNQKYSAHFELPVMKQAIEASGLVVKTYDRVASPAPGGKKFLSEIAFLQLKTETKKFVIDFLNAIRQL